MKPFLIAAFLLLTSFKSTPKTNYIEYYAEPALVKENGTYKATVDLIDKHGVVVICST